MNAVSNTRPPWSRGFQNSPPLRTSSLTSDIRCDVAKRPDKFGHTGHFPDAAAKPSVEQLQPDAFV
jgi:hypothetical protein